MRHAECKRAFCQNSRSLLSILVSFSQTGSMRKNQLEPASLKYPASSLASLECLILDHTDLMPAKKLRHPDDDYSVAPLLFRVTFGGRQAIENGKGKLRITMGLFKNNLTLCSVLFSDKYSSQIPSCKSLTYTSAFFGWASTFTVVWINPCTLPHSSLPGLPSLCADL